MDVQIDARVRFRVDINWHDADSDCCYDENSGCEWCDSTIESGMIPDSHSVDAALSFLLTEDGEFKRAHAQHGLRPVAIQGLHNGACYIEYEVQVGRDSVAELLSIMESCEGHVNRVMRSYVEYSVCC
jgi:hypothetical protein